MLFCSDRLSSVRFCPLNKHGPVAYPGFGTTKAETRAMPTDQHTPASTPTEESFRYTRSETVRILHDRLDPDRSAPSGRDAARTAGVPHTTLRYWHQRQRHTDAPPQLIAFFESPAGLAFLKRLLLALHLVFQQQGTAGIRPLCRFLELAQLAPQGLRVTGSPRYRHPAGFLRENWGPGRRRSASWRCCPWTDGPSTGTG